MLLKFKKKKLSMLFINESINVFRVNDAYFWTLPTIALLKSVESNVQ